jgi:hypothetical protein
MRQSGIFKCLPTELERKLIRVSRLALLSSTVWWESVNGGVVLTDLNVNDLQDDQYISDEETRGCVEWWNLRTEDLWKLSEISHRTSEAMQILPRANCAGGVRIPWKFKHHKEKDTSLLVMKCIEQRIKHSFILRLEDGKSWSESSPKVINASAPPFPHP